MLTYFARFCVATNCDKLSGSVYACGYESALVLAHAGRVPRRFRLCQHGLRPTKDAAPAPSCAHVVHAPWLRVEQQKGVSLRGPSRRLRLRWPDTLTGQQFPGAALLLPDL